MYKNNVSQRDRKTLQLKPRRHLQRSEEAIKASGFSSRDRSPTTFSSFLGATFSGMRETIDRSRTRAVQDEWGIRRGRALSQAAAASPAWRQLARVSSPRLGLEPRRLIARLNYPQRVDLELT